MHNLRRNLLLLTLVLLASACGGGGGSDAPGPTPEPSPEPGQITMAAPEEISVPADNAQGTPSTHQAIMAFLSSVTAFDANQVAVDNIIHDAPDTFPLGSTVVTFTATDAAGNTASVSSSVNVIDMTPPVVVLEGEGSMSLPVGADYDEPGAEALDNVDGDVSDSIEISGEVDTSVVGVYTLTYVVSDSAGNTSEPVERNVSVIAGNPPVVTAPENITVAAVDASGTPAVQADIAAFLTAASASDEEDGDLNDITNNAPEQFPLGSTTVVFSAQDSEGNTGIAQAIVSVTDQSPPEIEMLGEAEMVVQEGEQFNDPGVVASDNVDGDISHLVAVGGSVNTQIPGEYELEYSVSDVAGNNATPIFRQVTVEESVTPSTGMMVYFKKPDGWSSAYLYYWEAEPEGALANATWPGAKMQALGENWFRYQLANVERSNVIFSDNGGIQTDDLFREGDGCYDYDNAVWEDTCEIPLGVSSEPGSRTFSSETLEVVLSAWGDGVTGGLYTLDGADPETEGVEYSDGDSIVIGAELSEGDSITLQLYSSSGDEEARETMTFTKQAAPMAGDFSWDNATVYFVVTDRFLDADQSNNNSYGRERSADGEIYFGYQDLEGTFHGGDLKGLTQKLEDGYFTDLGVTAIWITSPLEQIHGYIGGEDFKHYAYHGYYHLDFTEIDANMGTEDEFAEFVDTAHEKGIRVVMDIVMNHAGYETIGDMAEFGFGSLGDGWSDYYFTDDSFSINYQTYGPFVQSGPGTEGAWSNWWGSEWIRKSNADGPYPGYTACGGNDTTMCLAGLPDFRTDSDAHVALPPLLVNKWGSEKTAAEQSELNAFFQDTGLSPTVANHMIKWLSDWVREYGIDGFRVDTAKHVELEVWNELKIQASAAYEQWKDENPDSLPGGQDLPFWMTGEVWDHGVWRSNYFDNGFDSVINFSFKDAAGNLENLEAIFSDYAGKVNSDSTFNVLSYLSSHDTALFDRGNMMNAGTSLLLLPGAVQIFYGDETNRPGDDDFHWDQPTRSDMNWDAIDQANLDHWQKLGQFRARHQAIGAGSHRQLSDAPYTFAREFGEDAVVVAIGATGRVVVSVEGVFADGESLIDAYSGQGVTVEDGSVTLPDISGPGVILLERAN